MNIAKLLTAAGLAVGVLLTAPVSAQSLDDLKNDEATPGNILTYGMGYSNQRYSELKQINTGNVGKLKAKWAYSLNNPQSHESQPIIFNGVMYVTTHDSTVALNPLTGRQIWKQQLEYKSDVFAMACCGLLNRGVAIYDGKVYRGTLDAHIVAYDASTGKELWRNKLADYKLGHAITSAPLLANGMLLSGIAGGEYGTRGFIAALDPQTGKEIWRFNTTAHGNDVGADTWPGDTALRGGAPTWLTGAYDPELDLVYWGTGNGGPWNPEVRKGDNLYINSVLAIKPKTGELVWYYQFSPNDPYDYDATELGMLVNMKVNGKDTKALVQANRNGFFYVLDRTNGKLLAANPYVKVNWADRIDMTTGRPVPSEVDKRVRAGADEEIFPSVLGGKNWTPMAWHPDTGLAYFNSLNMSWPYQLTKAEYKQGEWYLGVNFRGVTMPKDEPHGYMAAYDPMTGKAKWQVPWPAQPSMAGTLATAGGLIFTGAATGEIMAFDAKDGKVLWQFQAGAGNIGLPVTWEHDGKQYMSIVSGGGGVWALLGDERMASTPGGGTVWTFALD